MRFISAFDRHEPNSIGDQERVRCKMELAAAGRDIRTVCRPKSPGRKICQGKRSSSDAKSKRDGEISQEVPTVLVALVTATRCCISVCNRRQPLSGALCRPASNGFFEVETGPRQLRGDRAGVGDRGGPFIGKDDLGPCGRLLKDVARSVACAKRTTSRKLPDFSR